MPSHRIYKSSVQGKAELSKVQTLSGETHVLQIENRSWIPWLPFDNKWNASSAINSCLLSSLAYQFEEVDGPDGSLNTDSGPLSSTFFGLSSLSDRAVRVAATDIAPGGALPLMTRMVPEGDHFQDLRFWDSNQIGEECDLPPDWVGEPIDTFERYYSDTQAFAAPSPDQILISCCGRQRTGNKLWGKCRRDPEARSSEGWITKVFNSQFTRLLLLFVILGFFVGCGTSGEHPSVAGEDPVIRIAGSKIKEVQMGIDIKYISTSEKRSCKQFTARSATYVPINRAVRIWPDSDHVEGVGSFDPDVIKRVVPVNYLETSPPQQGVSQANYDTDKSGNSEEIGYEWVVPVSWPGEKVECDFTPTSFRLDLYHPTGRLMESVALTMNLGLGKNRRTSLSIPFEGQAIEVVCTTNRRGDQPTRGEMSCDLTDEIRDGEDVMGYTLDSLSVDTLVVPIHLNWSKQ